MALDDLKGIIEKLQGMINVHGDYLSAYETRTRQVLIDPLLQALGWDVSDPGTVQLEYKLREERNERADYGLMRANEPIAVVEAKHLGKSLKDNETKQANTYANENGIPYIIVTDGDRWEMYEVFKQAALEERLLMEFRLSKQSSHECALQALRIWKPNLASGSPKEAMEPVIEPPKEVAPALPAPDPDPKKDSSSANQLYLEYWEELKNNDDLRLRDSGIKLRKPQPQCWMGFAVGYSDFGIHTWASMEEKYIMVGLRADGTHGKSYFNRLKESMTEIEKGMDVKLEWQENPKQNYIRLYLPNTDLEDRGDWNRQHKWLCDNLKRFYSVFKPRIQALKKEQTS